jgi:hypothetical protein
MRVIDKKSGVLYQISQPSSSTLKKDATASRALGGGDNLWFWRFLIYCTLDTEVEC